MGLVQFMVGKVELRIMERMKPRQVKLIYRLKLQENQESNELLRVQE
jgi:hypothetical protein